MSLLLRKVCNDASGLLFFNSLTYVIQRKESVGLGCFEMYCHSNALACVFFRLVLILNNREVIEDALVNHSSAFSGRKPLYTESLVNPNNKGQDI